MVRVFNSLSVCESFFDQHMILHAQDFTYFSFWKLLAISESPIILIS